MGSKSGLNINLIFVTAVIVLAASFLFGFQIAVLNQPKKLIVSFYNATYTERSGVATSESTLTALWSLTTSLLIPGGLTGSFLGGWMADKHGRMKTVILSLVFAIAGVVASTACVAAGSPELLMLGRVLLGVHAGMGNCVAPMILLELSPSAYRGAFGTVHQLTICMGILLASVFGMPQLLGTESSWPLLFLVEGVPAVMTAVVIPFLHDTPRYLLLMNRNRAAAEKSMKFYRRTDDVEEELAEMDIEMSKFGDDASAAETSMTKATSASASANDEEFTWRRLVTEAETRKPLFIACMLVIIQQFSGINAFFFYSQSVFENAKISPAAIPFAVIGVNAVNVLATVIVVPLLDIAGRRPLLIIPNIIMCVDLLLMTVCLILQLQYTDVPAIGYLCITSVVIYVVCFEFGLGPIPWVLSPELFRQGPRSKAVSVVNVTMWIATFVISMSFESIQAMAQQYTFVVFLVMMIGFSVYLYIFVPETKNKTIDEIASLFSSNKESKSKALLTVT